ncbi:hypothetical protein [Bacillus sp. 123MFChir2]|uniref:hypothetical protein n=1 Tax=Bacillus sp. 123MFChir2 TaxID=1169144 RepID=UPI0003823CFB|nr:hypothetical protein [Bacillus sp. 123MFChir2]
MQIKFTLADAVGKFGNEKQKKSLIKNNGNLNKRTFESLIKTIQQHYETVKVEGKGKKRIIVCRGEYDFKMDREDNRRDNGAIVPYELEINSLVLNYVLQNCKNNFVSMSLNQWLLRFGLVDWKIINASYNEKLMKQHLELLKEKYGNKFSDNDIVMLEHFITTELNRLKRNLASVFHKLAKHNIIVHTVEMYCCQLNTEHRALSKQELTEIANIKRDLCKKHNIILKDLRFKSKNPSVKAFKNDFKESLTEMGFKYIYESHGCVVQVSDKILNEYFDKLIEKDELVISYGLSEDNIHSMMKDFKDSFTEHCLNSAERRQERENNRSDDRHIKYLKVFKEYFPMWEMLLIFYGLTSYFEPKHIDIDYIENNTSTDIKLI